jgi:hypothetical protein
VRYFTEDEARAYLPRLRRLLSLLQRSADLTVRSGTNGHATVKTAATADNAPLELDPAQVLVDFPSLHASGRVVQLCWQLGEDDLAWWHLPEDGFAGRRPLPVPPEL